MFKVLGYLYLISYIFFIKGPGFKGCQEDTSTFVINKQTEIGASKNIIIKNFHDIYKNLVRVKLSFEVIFRPIENSILKEISNQVKNCYK